MADDFWVGLVTAWAMMAASALVVASALLAVHGYALLPAVASSLGVVSLVAAAVRWWPP